MKMPVGFTTLRLIDTMNTIYSSILYSLIFAILCDAFPAPNSKEMAFARLIDQYENPGLNNPSIEMNQRELLESMKRLLSPDGTGRIENSSDYSIDDRLYPEAFEESLKNSIVSKRPSAAVGRYHYYKCYFNPVTCYRK